ncbi:hypothetical protein [Candidatus Poriferisocius sp.]|uniref:hypothetical protein n=1 Tax=Candidatus Poriferisocius sp. TaxID=3101276 RepID=UPI003B51C324
MSRIDVEYRADGISLILASQGFSMSVELSHSQADDLLEQLISQQSASTGQRTDSEGDCREFAQPEGEASGVGCQEVGSE